MGDEASGKVEVVVFPKKCTKCGQALRVEKKFSGAWWFECPTPGCDEKDDKDYRDESF